MPYMDPMGHGYPALRQLRVFSGVWQLPLQCGSAAHRRKSRLPGPARNGMTGSHGSKMSGATVQDQTDGNKFTHANPRKRYQLVSQVSTPQESVESVDIGCLHFQRS